MGDPLNGYDLNGREVTGHCLSGSYGWGLTVTGAICWVQDDHGGSALIFSPGAGGGFEASAGYANYYSNAPTIDDVLGWSTCLGGGIGALGGDVCYFKVDGRIYYSRGLSVMSGQKYGGHFVLSYTWKIKTYKKSRR